MAANRWEDIPLEQMNPRLGRRVMHGEKMTIAQVLLSKGAHVPMHHHPQEQTINLLSGKLEVGMDGKRILLEGGALLRIPPNMPHAVDALEDSVVLDVFAPSRDDWQRGDDQYLRG